MKDKYKIGVYGFWIFTVKKLIYGKYYTNYFETYGEVEKVTDTDIIIKDDAYDPEIIRHRIVWDRLIKFEKRNKPDVCLLNK